jgi:putative hydrolase of the HAD superfamily
MRNDSKLLLVLDAMGVIYPVKDDVADLLIPYVARHGGAPSTVVEEHYRAASLGNITEDEFWRKIGLSPSCEDDYLSEFMLSPGVLETLDMTARMGLRVAVLTNDVPRWSRKLRERFRLTEHIQTWVVSGEERCRKPDRGIYDSLIRKLGVTTNHTVLFVDDREKNLDTARRLGWQTVLFNPETDGSSGIHENIRGFHALTETISAYDRERGSSARESPRSPLRPLADC